MELLAAQTLAKELIQKHDLPSLGWSFKWDNAKRRRGCCSYGKKTIQLSRHYVKANELEAVKDTILHEIAHALSFIRYGRDGVGHGYLWKKTCREIGAIPVRAMQYGSLKKPANIHKPYHLIIAATGEIICKYYRKPSRIAENIKYVSINGRKAETLGKLELRKVTSVGEIVEVWPKKVLTFS